MGGEARLEAISLAAFVHSSSHRSSAMETLRDWPKTTGQVAVSCGLGSPHASRALRELMERGLVVCATPDLQGRGRLYALTELGLSVGTLLDRQGSHSTIAPLVKATHPRAWYSVLRDSHGEGRALEVLEAAGCDRVVTNPRQWIPLRCQLRLLEEVERLFGDGSNSTVRHFASEAVRYYPSVRKLLMRALPLRLLVELTPGAYLREFNHGRIETDQSPGRAKFRQYDWLSSSARCFAWLGSYEGVFDWMGVEAVLTKQECMLKGDEFCGYVATWDE